MPITGSLTKDVWDAPEVVPKDQDRGNDMHGCKIIVVPFDGAAMDRDLQNAAKPSRAAGTPEQGR